MSCLVDLGGRPTGSVTKRPEEEGKKAEGDRTGGGLFTEADPGEAARNPRPDKAERQFPGCGFREL